MDQVGSGSHTENRMLLEIAKRAALAAAEVHRRSIHDQNFAIGTKSSASDLVTSVDRESERTLVEIIRRERPSDKIIGEEGTSLGGDTGVEWILDPLDGTTNFVHRHYPHSVAIGIKVNGKVMIGV